MAIKVKIHEGGADPIYCICQIVEVKDEVTGAIVTIADKTTEKFISKSQLETQRAEIEEILQQINQ